MACGGGSTLGASCVLGGLAVMTLSVGLGDRRAGLGLRGGFGPCVPLFAYGRGQEQGPQGRRPEREGYLGHTGQQSRLL